jgi:adenosylcobinamide-phosphate synthase
MIVYHGIAFLAGFVLDLLFGDPHWLPHPIRLIGRLISFLEKKLYDETKNLRARGGVLVVLVLFITGVVSGGILYFVYRIQPVAGCAVESIMTYQILAVRSLKVESMKVYDALQTGTIEDARRAVSMIVGRDTACLDEAGVTKAAVETVAENTSDGVIAPMIVLAVGGPFLGFLYKAVNTMDSMIGYKNDRYLLFGRTAAKLDDVVNYLPARISAYLMIAAAYLAGRDFDGTRAFSVYRRDRRKHASPNSAHTEAVCAGALGVRLAGDASYFGKIVKKPYIGDDVRPVEISDIRRANRLLYVTAFLCEAILLVLLIVVCAVVAGS